MATKEIDNEEQALLKQLADLRAKKKEKSESAYVNKANAILTELKATLDDKAIARVIYYLEKNRAKSPRKTKAV